MELDDCSYGELHSVTVTHCMKNAASKADYLVILDPLDNNSHPDRFQLLKTSSLLYKDIATAIKGIVKPEAKVSFFCSVRNWKSRLHISEFRVVFC